MKVSQKIVIYLIVVQQLVQKMLKVVIIKNKKCKQSKSKKKSGIFDRPSDEVVKKQFWPQAKLQFEYAGSKVSFEDLEFNLFVAGEIEIISSRNIDKVEKNGRIKTTKENCILF